MLEKMIDMAREIMENGELVMLVPFGATEFYYYKYQGAEWRLTFTDDYIKEIAHM